MSNLIQDLEALGFFPAYANGKGEDAFVKEVTSLGVTARAVITVKDQLRIYWRCADASREGEALIWFSNFGELTAEKVAEELKFVAKHIDHALMIRTTKPNPAVISAIAKLA